jgi:hypothetical protein
VTLRISINGQNYTTKWRPFESRWTSRAYLGESSQSEFIIDDDGTIQHSDLASRKIVEVWENATGVDICMYRGRIANKSLGRGTQIVGDAMRWTVITEDSNIDARGIRVDDSTRPAESDRERVLAYLAGYLNGAASTNPNARDSTDIDGTYVLNADLVDLPAETYTDTFPAEVFARIGEISAKTWFVYVSNDGSMDMYYATHDDTTLASDISITDNELDADGVDVYNPYLGSSTGEHDGQALISGGSLRYGDNSFYEFSHPGSESDHDKWEEHFTDEYVINQGSAEAFLENIVASRNNEEFRYICTIDMPATEAHRIKAGMSVPIRLASANAPTQIDQRAVQVTHEPITNLVYRVTAEFGVPRGRPFRRNIRTKPGPFEPTTPSATNSARLYHSAHTAGSGSTAESLASPNLTSGDIAAGWEFTSGGAFEYYQLYDDPAASTSGASVAWSATDAAAGQAVIRGYVHRLDGDLLAIIQGGGTVHMQARSRSRYGTGISESAQNNTSYWTIRVYRPSSTSFIGTPVAMSAGGSSSWPAQETYVNRFWSATLTAVGGAVAGDYLVIDVGANHITPVTGGTGATILFEDRFADDLPEDEINTGSRNSWVEFTGTETGDSTEPVVQPGEETPGTSNVYSPLDHTHSHGLLADDGIHMHDADQIDGLDNIDTTVTLDGGMAGLLAGNAFLYFVHRDNAGDYQMYLLAGTDGADFDTVLGPEPQFTPITTGAEARDGGLAKWRNAFYGLHTGGTAGSGNERFTIYRWDDLDAAPTFVASPGFSGSISGVTAVWAPKFFRDPEQSIDTLPYVVFAGADGGTAGSPSSFAPYYVQATADDLSTYSAATAITGTGFPAESIDPFIAYMPDYGTAGQPYKLFLVDDGAAKTVGVWESASPFSGYVALDSDLAWSATDHEAPVVIDMGDGRWRGYYNKHSGFDSLGAFYRDWTPDGGWGSEGEVTTPWLEAHGTVVRIADEFTPVVDAGVSDHGALTGLADDDHPQYLLVADLADEIAAAGHYEVIVSGTAPPVAVTNVAEDDWLYGFVT